MTIPLPCPRANRFNRLLKSSSSATNSSLLKPPTLRNTAVSMKIKEPASSLRNRLAQFQSCVTHWPKNAVYPAGPSRRRQGISRTGFVRHVRKQFRARMRIGIHKNQPVAGRRRRAGVSRAGDLVDRFEYDNCARARAQFPVSGPWNYCHKRLSRFPIRFARTPRRRLSDLCQRFAQQPLFVKRGNDNGNFHAGEVVTFNVPESRSRRQLVPDCVGCTVVFLSCFFRQMALIGGMTIWILALLLLAAGAGMGLRQGAIRVAISFVGIIISALLAWPLSGIIRPLLPHVGFHNLFVVNCWRRFWFSSFC